MKKSGYLLFLFSVIILFMAEGDLTAQHGMRVDDKVTVTGWTDDNHYLLWMPDGNGGGLTHRVNIRNGRSADYVPALTPLAAFVRALPAEIRDGRQYIVSPDLSCAIVTSGNDLFLYSKDINTLRRLTCSPGAELNTAFAPDGSGIAYTREGDLYYYDLKSFSETRLTHDASAKVYNGYASWVYMEEILGRSSRYSAFWWSPDSRRIAFLRTDESDVPLFTLNRLEEADGLHGALEQVPYPKPGDPNPCVRMGIADVRNAGVVWVKTDENTDQYLAWPFWTPDGSRLAIQVVNRQQNRLSIVLADPSSGNYRTIYRDSSSTWLEFHENVHVMKDGSGFLLTGNSGGWNNIFYHGWDGRLISRVTDLGFNITSVERVDEMAGMVYFYATGPVSTESHFFRVALDGSGLLQVTGGRGTHMVSVSPSGSWFIDTWSNTDDPGALVAYDRKGKQLREVYRNEKPQFDPDLNQRNELVRIPSSDGRYSLPAMITYPAGFDPSHRYPVVFKIYGGPGRKNVTDEWKGLSPSWYAMNGIIVFTVDHRGSGHFGKEGEDYLYRSLGKWEIQDYSDAVAWLREKPFVESSMIGITGSSYGGYLTCLALTRGADFWTHGFAKSSVTDWRLYDNIYTERYMNKPGDNPEGYRDASVMSWTANYSGKLYISHGDIDDNVHFQNSLRLISKLQDEGKTFEFMLYPGNRHGYTRYKAVHSLNEEYNFWLKHFRVR